jgi:hypothetical protein
LRLVDAEESLKFFKLKFVLTKLAEKPNQKANRKIEKLGEYEAKGGSGGDTLRGYRNGGV